MAALKFTETHNLVAFLSKPEESDGFEQIVDFLNANPFNYALTVNPTIYTSCIEQFWTTAKAKTVNEERQFRLAKRSTVDSFDDLFDYLQQFEKLVNASRAKKLEKSHDPLALVAHTSASSRNTSSYYVTHPTSVVDYDDEYEQDDVQTNFEDPLASLMLVNIQSRNSGNTGRNTRRAYVQVEVVEGSNAQNETENVQRTLRTSSAGNATIVQCYNCGGKEHYARNCPKPRVRDSKYFMEQMLLAKLDGAGVILTNEQNNFLFVDASRMEEIEEFSANICLMARIQPADDTSDAGAMVLHLLVSTISDDQIDSNIIFDEPNGIVNSVQQQNTTLSSQLELYKKRVRVLENIKGDNNYLNEFLEADRQAKHFNQQAQSQFVRDRDIIRDLEKQRDKLDLAVTDYKRKNEELQKTHLILKRQMSENEDRYHDTILDLEAKLEKTVMEENELLGLNYTVDEITRCVVLYYHGNPKNDTSFMVNTDMTSDDA
ncbi:retrovirus-related pol polyprotein from transposon TNT 1-94 [Tanacetum coccineum]